MMMMVVVVVGILFVTSLWCTATATATAVHENEGLPIGAGPALWPWPQILYVPDVSVVAPVPFDASGFEIACEVDNPCPASFRARLDYYTKLVQHSCANQVYAPSAPPYADAEAFAFGSWRKPTRAVSGNTGGDPDHTLNSCTVKLDTDIEALTIGMNMTYTVDIESTPYPYCQITANNMFGAYYAFLTVAQLCDTSGSEQAIRTARIVDFPRFDFRGLLIDSARHFLPVSYIKRVIDNMALLRLNVLHWHLVDSESFPVESETFPNLTQAAWHPKAVYSTDDMKDVVQYAYARGVTVMPEFDIPGHGSWGKGYPDLMGCDTVLDPTNPDVYTFLKSFLQEMLDVFPSEYIFLGGDEVNADCWLQNPEIKAWMNRHNMVDPKELFDYFWQNVTSEILPDLGRKVGVWQSDKIDIKPSLLPPGSFGNVWQDPKTMVDVIEAGMPVVLSGPWYLDVENPITASGKCQEYAWQMTWQCMYAEEPSDQIDRTQEDSMLGGMAAMWGEGVNHNDFDARVWAKAAAVAERLWSSYIIHNMTGATSRLDRHICRLNLLGINAGPIKPGFCLSDLDI